MSRRLLVSPHSIIRLFDYSIFSLLFLGCVSSQSGVERATDNWTLRKTTRRDVVRAWGNPDAVLNDVWIWRSRKVAGGKVKASFMMVGATVENRAYSTYEHRLRFGPDGTLADEQIVDYTPGQDEWSINPWN